MYRSRLRVLDLVDLLKCVELSARIPCRGGQKLRLSIDGSALYRRSVRTQRDFRGIYLAILVMTVEIDRRRWKTLPDMNIPNS